MRTSAKLVIVAVALACLSNMQRSAFLTPPRRSVTLPAAATVGGMLGAAPAFSDDQIGIAAKKLAGAAYPFLKDIDWNSGAVTRTVLTKPGEATAADWTKAVAKAIDMGAAMDPELLKKGVLAHHNGIPSASLDVRGVTSQSDFEEIIAAIGRMIASVPEEKTMGVYDSFSKLVSPDVPAYLMKSVKEADAKAAYAALMEFKDVVKANPTSASVVPTALSSAKSDQIEAAAAKLSSAAYPFVKDIDWSSDLPLKTSAYSANVPKVLKAVDKALVMGASMDSNALREAALAHVKAIENMDAKGVATQEDFKAILAGLGKAIAPMPTKTVMDVYNAFGDTLNTNVPKYLMSSVKATDAMLAYNSFMEFKDVVKAAR